MSTPGMTPVPPPPEERTYEERQNDRERKVLRALLCGFALQGILASGCGGKTPIGDAVYYADNLLKELGL